MLSPVICWEHGVGICGVVQAPKLVEKYGRKGKEANHVGRHLVISAHLLLGHPKKKEKEKGSPGHGREQISKEAKKKHHTFTLWLGLDPCSGSCTTSSYLTSMSVCGNTHTDTFSHSLTSHDRSNTRFGDRDGCGVQGRNNSAKRSRR